MNIYLHTLAFLSFLLAIAIPTNAQTTPLANKSTAQAVAVKVSYKKPVKRTPINTASTRHQKRLPLKYNGYAIEVAASNYPLAPNHLIFKQFGKVYYDKLVEGGYSYVIQTNFNKQTSAEQFLKNIILPKVSEARLIDYKEGKRVVLETKDKK